MSTLASSETPFHRSRSGEMSLSVSAVFPTCRTISRTSSSDSSIGSSPDFTTPRRQRQQQGFKNRVAQLAFPYTPAPTISNPYIIASEAEPLKSIPLYLIPNDNTRQLPPILHLGWSVDEDKFLEWCAGEGFRRTITDINGHHVFDYTGTVSGALHYFAQRSGVGAAFKPHIQLTCHRKDPIIIALTSNYSLSPGLDGKKREIFTLGSLLRREGLLSQDSPVARWYIDFKEWQWVLNKPK